MLKIKSHKTYPTMETLTFDIVDTIKNKIDTSIVVTNDMVTPIIKAIMNIDNIDVSLIDYDNIDYLGEYYIDVIWLDDVPILFVKKAWNEKRESFVESEAEFYFVASDVDKDIYKCLHGIGEVFTIED